MEIHFSNNPHSTYDLQQFSLISINKITCRMFPSHFKIRISSTERNIMCDKLLLTEYVCKICSLQSSDLKLHWQIIFEFLPNEICMKQIKYDNCRIKLISVLRREFPYNFLIFKPCESSHSLLSWDGAILLTKNT